MCIKFQVFNIVEVFNNFKAEVGIFKACVCEDVKRLLYLYEASYLSTMAIIFWMRPKLSRINISKEA